MLESQWESGLTINIILEKYGIKFPAYLMGMVVAAIMRNVIDASQKPLHQ